MYFWQRTSRFGCGRTRWGRPPIDGVVAVSGGVVGDYGDIVLDNVHEPKRVIGVADGKGGVLFDYPPEVASRVETVEAALRDRLLLPRSLLSS